MNKYLLVIISLVILSCKENKTTKVKPYSLQDFIEVDVNTDFQSYYNHLATDYIKILRKEYRSATPKAIIDSIKANSQSAVKSIKNGDVQVQYVLTDSLYMSKDDISIFKYRLKVYDRINDSKLFQEKIIVSINENGATKYFPYNISKRPEVREILLNLYNENVSNKIDSILQMPTFDNTNTKKDGIIKSFNEYFSLINSGNPDFINYIYPALFEEVLQESIQSELTYEQKMKYVESYQKAKAKQELDFKNYHIEDVTEIECPSEISSYNITYAIQVKSNMYIPGNAIVIEKNRQFYFLELEYDYLIKNYPNMFNSDYLECLKEIAK